MFAGKQLKVKRSLEFERKYFKLLFIYLLLADLMKVCKVFSKIYSIKKCVHAYIFCCHIFLNGDFDGYPYFEIH